MRFRVSTVKANRNKGIEALSYFMRDLARTQDTVGLDCKLKRFSPDKLQDFTYLRMQQGFPSGQLYPEKAQGFSLNNNRPEQIHSERRIGTAFILIFRCNPAVPAA
jgi:hypothetical protein